MQDDKNKFDFYKLGRRDRDASLSQIQQDEIHVQKILTFLKRESGIMTIAGNPGAGKTYICKAIINDWIKNVYECRYMPAAHFISQIKSMIGEDYDTGAEVRRLCETKWLIIDDFGSSWSEWQGEIWYEVVNTRHENQLPTIITSNFLEYDMKIKCPRIHSRLKDKTNVFIEIKSHDKRQE